ncbi:hypothetical protein [Aeromicrobium sp. HA]|uniref:hypothetical protein n=1 Tax=Aeromicrobium sp. HA TaxID=3009077 RepID=UPI0022AF5797|nr:hypothetical protein [Aeromicrobium sp. HA]
MTAVSNAVVNDAHEQASFKMSRRRWRDLLGELQRRGDDRRESGAFLLAANTGDHVERVVYYDDLDARCLTGGISFSTTGFTELWRICEEQALRVVADVHTHPSTWVQQSEIDASNPMMARVGHVAMIVPSYGHARSVEECGVHIYLGSYQWIALPAGNVSAVVEIYGLFSRAQTRHFWNMLTRVFGRMTPS